MSNQKIVIACVITAVLAGGVGYVGGVKMSPLKRSVMFNSRSGQTMNLRNNNQNNQNGKGITNAPNMMGRGGAITGEVIAKDNKSLTIKMSDGSSKIVIISDKTIYRMASESSLDKIEVGTKVATFGDSNSDGSTTATSIEINPAMMGQK